MLLLGFVVISIVVIISLFFDNIGDYHQSPEEVGAVFEKDVCRKIEHTLAGTEEYIIKRNVICPHPSKPGQTSEIDILILHEKGIIALECKNFAGWIFGDLNSTYWMQTLHRSKFQFLNPIIQNRTHIRALGKYLHISENEILSYIVFSNRSEFKQIPSDSPFMRIMHGFDLSSRLNVDICAAFPTKYNYQLIQNISEKLDAFKFEHGGNTNWRQQHTNTVRTGMTRCPYCGGPLVKRTNSRTYNQFLGCQNYPKCRYTAATKIQDIEAR